MFSVTGLDIVTRTRVDHLPDDEKEKQKCTFSYFLSLSHSNILFPTAAGSNPLQGLLGMSEEETSETALPGGGLLPGGTTVSESNSTDDSVQLSMAEYFTSPKDPKKYDGKLITNSHL